jgi:hypothetical protein
MFSIEKLVHNEVSFNTGDGTATSGVEIVCDTTVESCGTVERF